MNFDRCFSWASQLKHVKHIHAYTGEKPNQYKYCQWILALVGFQIASSVMSHLGGGTSYYGLYREAPP